MSSWRSDGSASTHPTRQPGEEDGDDGEYRAVVKAVGLCGVFGHERALQHADLFELTGGFQAGVFQGGQGAGVGFLGELGLQFQGFVFCRNTVERVAGGLGQAVALFDDLVAQGFDVAFYLAQLGGLGALEAGQGVALGLEAGQVGFEGSNDLVDAFHRAGG